MLPLIRNEDYLYQVPNFDDFRLSAIFLQQDEIGIRLNPNQTGVRMKRLILTYGDFFRSHRRR